MTVTPTFYHRRQSSNVTASGVVKRAPRANARAWRPEEDEFLLQARSRSTPYKQIAAHLNKTELACRLHYHQMTFGAHRRRNNMAASGNQSEGSRSPMSVHDGRHPGFVTPSITVSYSPSPRTTFSYSPGVSSVKSYTSPTTSVGSEWCSPQTSQRPSSSTGVPNHGIGLTWPQAPAPLSSMSSTIQDAPDLGRVLQEYAQQNKLFWSNVADQFPNFSQSPAELEAAVRTALGQKSSSVSPSPDTRYLSPTNWSGGDSHKRALSEPQESFSRSLHSPSPKRCTVSSLLNFEKDTGAQKWGLSGA